MLCILYVLVISTLLGLVGLMAEEALPVSFPRRWMWCVILLTSIVLPGYNRFHNTFSADPALWAKPESYNSAINPLWLAGSALVVLWGLINACRVTWLVYTA